MYRLQLVRDRYSQIGALGPNGHWRALFLGLSNNF